MGLGHTTEATGLNKNRRYADLKKRRHAGLKTGGNRPQNEGTRSLKIKGFLRNEGPTLASANMPDTKTQAEGTPCSLVLQPNIVKGVEVIGEKTVNII